VAVASAGPYASLHLAPDRQPRQHPTTQFLQAGCPSCHPTNSVKAPKEPREIHTVVSLSQSVTILLLLSSYCLHCYGWALERASACIDRLTRCWRGQGCSGGGTRGTDPPPVNTSEGERRSTKCSQYQLNGERNIVFKRPGQFI